MNRILSSVYAYNKHSKPALIHNVVDRWQWSYPNTKYFNYIQCTHGSASVDIQPFLWGCVGKFKFIFLAMFQYQYNIWAFIELNYFDILGPFDKIKWDSSNHLINLYYKVPITPILLNGIKIVRDACTD